MFGIRILGDKELTFGEFASDRKAVWFGLSEFGNLCAWEVIRLA